MCSKVTCATCGKPTWRGCGQHIEEALAGVAPADRCQCAPADTPSVATVKSKGILARFLGR